jgi:hypothetical protein
VVRSALCVSCLVCASAAAQVLGPVTQLDAPVRWVSQREQSWPDVAATLQGGFVTVWQDERAGRGFDLWGAVVNAEGVAVSRANMPLLVRPGPQTQPVVAVGSAGALVVALDGAMCGHEVLALPLDLATLAPARLPVLLSTNACTSDRPALAWHEGLGRFLVVWGRHGSGEELHGAMLDATGQVVLPDFVIASAANSARQPAVIATAQGFLVTWADDRAMAQRFVLHAATVSGTGVVGAPAVVSPGIASQTSPCLAPGFLAWVEQGAVQGVAIDGQGTAVGPVRDGGAGAGPSCRAAGGQLRVAHEAGAAGGVVVRGFDVSSGFGPAVTPIPPTNWTPRQPRLVSDGAATKLFVVATQDTTYVGGPDVLGRALFPDLSFDAGQVLLGTSAAPQQQVVAAFDGRRYLVAWNDLSRFTSYEAIGQLVEPGSGRLLAGDAGLTLSVTSHNLASYPSLAGAPDAGFFLSWGDVGSAGLLMGRPVSSDGVPGAWLRLNDTSTYVNHHVSRALPGQFVTLSLKSDTLRVRRTDFAGATLQPETVLTMTAPGATQLAAAALGDRLFVVIPSLGDELQGLMVTADGGLGSVVQLTQRPGPEGDPAVAAGGGGFLVAWAGTVDGGATAPRQLVFVSRVEASLLVRAPTVVGTGAEPTIAWLGSRFFVAWVQGEDLVGAPVTVDGVVGAQRVLVATPELERRPTLTSGPSGQALLTWEAYVAEPPFQGFRAHARLILDGLSEEPDGGADGGALPGADAGVDGGQPLVDGGADAGADDAGAGLDAGAPTDGGAPDDGGLPSDGGSTDGDAGPDQGPPDAETPDAGAQRRPTDGPPREFSVGCSSAPLAWWSAALALLLVRRRAGRAGP